MEQSPEKVEYASILIKMWYTTKKTCASEMVGVCTLEDPSMCMSMSSVWYELFNACRYSIMMQ